jgi:hypothetical protein
MICISQYMFLSSLLPLALAILSPPHSNLRPKQILGATSLVNENSYEDDTIEDAPSHIFGSK